MYSFQTTLFINTMYAIQQSEPLRAYWEIFNVLDLSAIPDRTHDFGRKGYSIHAIIRALIVKHRERIDSIPRLIDHLKGNPILSELCGFPNGILPDASQFYRFLQHTRHSVFERILHAVNKTLIEKKAISLDTFILDSKPVLAATKENNPKNVDRNITKKEQKPKRNPDATLGYLAKEPGGSLSFFWGYRTHVIVSKEGIPLVECTLPNSATDADVATTLIKRLKKLYAFKKDALFIADKAYDVNDLYDLIIDRFKCQAFIPINSRATKTPHSLGDHGRPLCDAGLEMAYDGAYFDKRRRTIKRKFICPNKKSKNHGMVCPVNHPKSHGYGCTKYFSDVRTARVSVPRDSTHFTREYAKRITVEQYFSRLGPIEAEQTSHYKLRTVKNQITIAHLTQSLVALAAISMNKPEFIRCYRTFAHVA
jgi:hypothetical protein